MVNQSADERQSIYADPYVNSRSGLSGISLQDDFSCALIRYPEN